MVLEKWHSTTATVALSILGNGNKQTHTHPHTTKLKESRICKTFITYHMHGETGIAAAAAMASTLLKKRIEARNKRLRIIMHQLNWLH